MSYEMKMVRAVLSCLLIAVTVHAEVRTWRSATGAKLQAEFLGVADGKVTLETPAGKVLRIDLSKLSHPDQQFIKQLTGVEATAPESKGGEVPASGSKSGSAGPVASVASEDAKSLPYIEGEDWIQIWDGTRKIRGGKGITRQSHAIYEGRKYRAVIDERGVLSVQMMNNGEKVGYPMRMGHYCWKLGTDGKYLKDDDGKGVAHRPVEKFIDPPAPSRNPDKVHLKGVREDNVHWELVYEFSPDYLTAQSWVKDPGSISHASYYWQNFTLAPSHEFDRTTSIAEQKRATANCKVTADLRGEGSESFGYTSSQSLSKLINSAKVAGHYAPLTVSFDVAESDKWAHLRGYPGQPLYNGYNVRGQMHAGADSGAKGKKGKPADREVWEKTPKIKLTIK